MKKIKFILIAAVMTIIPSVSLAASLSLAPSVGEYTEGQTYSVSVFVDPSGKTVYTAKMDLSYPVDLLEVKSFTFGGSWMPLNQPGYDAIDNTNGVLIKSGGYPGGLNSKVLLGTVSFYAKKTGLAVVEVTDNSLILDDSSQNIFSDPAKAIFTLVIKPVVPVIAPIVKEIKKDVTKIEIPVIKETNDSESLVAEEDSESLESEIDNTDNLATINEVGADIFSFSLLNTFLVILVAFIIGLFVGRKTSLFSDYM